MRSMSHRHARITGSNTSSPPSANSIKKWIAKNGLPPVFSCTSSANGRARSGSQWSASAINRPTSSSAIGADQQQVPHFRVRDEMLEEVERCCIQPLQIIEEQRERVLLAREHPEEAPEHHLEAVLRVLWRQVRDRWLFPNHELQFGNEVDDELTVRAQRLAQGIPPPAKLRLAPAQERAHKALEGLGQGGVRDVALVLVELAGREQATRRYERLVQLVHH